MRVKALKYLFANDKKLFIKFFLDKPFLYFLRFFSSLFSQKKREEDIFLFGINSLAEFHLLVKDEKNPLLLGFSYCQKPFACPSPRFSEACLGSACCKCLISKYLDMKNVHFLSITTVNKLGEKIYEIVKQRPSKILFIISACEMAISMFGDLAKMLNLKGVAIPLKGEVCSTFSSFLAAEKGEKKGQAQFPMKSLSLLNSILASRNK